MLPRVPGARLADFNCGVGRQRASRASRAGFRTTARRATRGAGPACPDSMPTKPASPFVCRAPWAASPTRRTQLGAFSAARGGFRTALGPASAVPADRAASRARADARPDARCVPVGSFKSQQTGARAPTVQLAASNPHMAATRRAWRAPERSTRRRRGRPRAACALLAGSTTLPPACRCANCAYRARCRRATALRRAKIALAVARSVTLAARRRCAHCAPQADSKTPQAQASAHSAHEDGTAQPPAARTQRACRATAATFRTPAAVLRAMPVHRDSSKTRQGTRCVARAARARFRPESPPPSAVIAPLARTAVGAWCPSAPHANPGGSRVATAPPRASCASPGSSKLVMVAAVRRRARTAVQDNFSLRRARARVSRARWGSFSRGHAATRRACRARPVSSRQGRTRQRA